MSKKEIEKVLQLQLKNVQNNVEILTREEVGSDCLIRLDTSLMTRKSFYPKIAHSQANTEDRTLPRITASPYLLGCIIAVPFINPNIYDNLNIGHYIHSLEFDYCLKPTNKLVFDSSETNELWLLTYNKNTVEYKPKLAGELIVKQYLITPSNTNTFQECVVTIYVKIIKEEGIKFNKKIKLNKGYWSISFPLTESKTKYSITTINSEKNITIADISESEFNTARKKQTVLESLIPLVKHRLSDW